jgi:hypothetical protein
VSSRVSPLIRLQAARRQLDLAEERCPHWDYEGDGGEHAECCLELQAAEHQVRKARKAYLQSEGRL